MNLSSSFIAEAKNQVRMGVLELTALPRETAYAGASAGSMVVTPNFGDEDTRVDFLF